MSDLTGDEVLEVVTLFLSQKSDSHMAVGKIVGGPDEGKYFSSATWRVEGDVYNVSSLPQETVNEAIVSLIERIDYPEYQRRF